MQESMWNLKKGFSGFHLKIIAALTMLCSHVYKGVLMGHNEFMFLDIIGRIAFPVFCFLLVEGFCYTKNRRKYLFRLWVFAVLSEIPFDVLFYGTYVTFMTQNVLFTMLIGFLTIWGMEKAGNRYQWPVLVAGMVAAWVCRTDYSVWGIWIIACFYVFRGMKKECFGIQIANMCVSVVLFRWYQIFGLLGLLILWFYNGREGRKWKYFFYIFYPFHMLLLFLCESISNQVNIEIVGK